MSMGLMAGAGVFVFMVGVSTLFLAALQAIGFAMFSGLKAPQRPSYKTLMGVQFIEILGVAVLVYLLNFLLPSPIIALSAGVEGAIALLLVAVVVYLLIALLAPLVATVAVVKCSLRQAALSLVLFYVPILLGALFLLYVIVGAASDSGLGRSQDGAQAPTVSTVGEDTAQDASPTEVAAQDANGETQTASDSDDLITRYAQAVCASQREDMPLDERVSAMQRMSVLTVEIAEAQEGLTDDERINFMMRIATVGLECDTATTSPVTLPDEPVSASPAVSTSAAPASTSVMTSEETIIVREIELQRDYSVLLTVDRVDYNQEGMNFWVTPEDATLHDFIAANIGQPIIVTYQMEPLDFWIVKARKP